jgi:hypothetical protein
VLLGRRDDVVVGLALDGLSARTVDRLHRILLGWVGSLGTGTIPTRARAA